MPKSFTYSVEGRPIMQLCTGKRHGAVNVRGRHTMTPIIDKKAKWRLLFQPLAEKPFLFCGKLFVFNKYTKKLPLSSGFLPSEATKFNRGRGMFWLSLKTSTRNILALSATPVLFEDGTQYVVSLTPKASMPSPPPSLKPHCPLPSQPISIGPFALPCLGFSSCHYLRIYLIIARPLRCAIHS